MKKTTPVFPYWILSTCLLLAGGHLLQWQNGVTGFENFRIAVEARTLRAGTHLDASRERLLHPHIQEWEVNIPQSGSYVIALQYDQLLPDSLFQGNHRAAMNGGKHVVRLEREQLPENQRLRVWVDGTEVLSLPMQDDWQRTTIRSSIGNETRLLRSNQRGENQVLVLEEFRFIEVSQSGVEEAKKGVLLFVALAEKSDAL